MKNTVEQSLLSQLEKTSSIIKDFENFIILGKNADQSENDIMEYFLVDCDISKLTRPNHIKEVQKSFQGTTREEFKTSKFLPVDNEKKLDSKLKDEDLEFLSIFNMTALAHAIFDDLAQFANNSYMD